MLATHLLWHPLLLRTHLGSIMLMVLHACDGCHRHCLSALLIPPLNQWLSMTKELAAARSQQPHSLQTWLAVAAAQPALASLHARSAGIVRKIHRLSLSAWDR